MTVQSPPPDAAPWSERGYKRILVALGCLTGLSLLSIVYQPRWERCGFWVGWIGSSAERLYCAQRLVQDPTLEHLRQAIALISGIGPSSELYPDAQKYLPQLIRQTLDQAQEVYDQGKLEQALEVLKELPRPACQEGLCLGKEIDARMQRWQQTWQKAEQIYAEAEAALTDQNWDRAAAIATQLLGLDNRYWRTNRYEFLSAQIQEIRMGDSLLSRARDLARSGSSDNLLRAIALVDQVQRSSRIWPIARSIRDEYQTQLLDIAQKSVDARRPQEAIALVDRLPTTADFRAVKTDFRTLVLWQQRTWSGQSSDLQRVIALAQKFPGDRPLYDRSQQLVSRWEQELNDNGRIEQAKLLARSGKQFDLQSAIAAVSGIPYTHPRWPEVQALQRGWTAQVERYEDLPLIHQAESYAKAGDLIPAISLMQQITPGRALYPQARERWQQWQAIVDQREDEQTLAQAESFAQGGNLEEAIDIASGVTSNRPLYDRAQALVQGWKAQLAPPPEPTAPVITPQTPNAPPELELTQPRPLSPESAPGLRPPAPVPVAPSVP